MGSLCGGRFVLSIAVYAAAVALVHFLYHRTECATDKRGQLTFRQAQYYAALNRLSVGCIGCILHFGSWRELSRESFQYRTYRSGECLAAASIGTAHYSDGLDDSRLSEDSTSVGGPPEAEGNEKRQLSFDIFDRIGFCCRLDSLYRSDFFIDPAVGECDGVATGAVSADVRAWLFGAIPAGNFFHRKAQVHFEIQRNIHENRRVADDPVRPVVAHRKA